MVNIRKFLTGLGLIPVSSTSIDTKGELEVLSTGGYLQYHDGSSAQKVLTASNTVTVSGKSMDGGSNTFTNLPTSSFSGQTSVSNGGTGASSLTAHGVVIGEGTSPVAVTSAGTSGQPLLSGGASADPNWGTLSVSFGGTGDTTLTAHGVLLGQGTSAITATAVGATNTVLHGNTGADPTYSAIVNADITNATIDLTTKVTNTLPVGNGGTGQSTLTAHSVLIGNTTSGITQSSVGATGTVLHGNTGADPTFSAVSLTADVSGVLPAANVGLVRTINAQTGTTYTFVLADGSAAGGNPLVTASNASAQTYTVPTHASVAFPVGTQIDVLQLGSGKVTMAAAGGVTINSKGGNLSISAQYVGVSLINTATDVWQLMGDLIT